MTVTSNQPTTPFPDDDANAVEAAELVQFQLYVSGTPAIIAAIRQGVVRILAQHGFDSAESRVARVPTAKEREEEMRRWEAETENRPRLLPIYVVMGISLLMMLVGIALGALFIKSLNGPTKIWMTGIDPFFCKIPVMVRCDDCPGFAEDLTSESLGGIVAVPPEFDADWQREYTLESGRSYTFWVDMSKIDLKCLNNLGIGEDLMPKVKIIDNSTKLPLDYFVQSCVEGGGEENCKAFEDFGWRNGGGLRTLPGGELEIRVNPPPN